MTKLERYVSSSSIVYGICDYRRSMHLTTRLINPQMTQNNREKKRKKLKIPFKAPASRAKPNRMSPSAAFFLTGGLRGPGKLSRCAN
jgi:hypothetical protein